MLLRFVEMKYNLPHTGKIATTLQIISENSYSSAFPNILTKSEMRLV
jgi:hypothetical protein